MNKQEIKEYLESRGFAVTNTGGNCQAYRADYDDEGQYHVLIAQECSLPVDDGAADEDIAIALFDADGEMIGDFVGPLVDVMHWHDWAAREIIGEIENEVNSHA